MTIIKKIVKIVPPMDGVYHVLTDKNKLVIVVKCTGRNVCAPLAGTIVDFSKHERFIKIVTEDTTTEILIKLPDVSAEMLNFYINRGERVTQGLKLAEMKALTGDLIVTTINLNEHCQYKVCK